MEFDNDGLIICPQCKKHYKPKVERPKGDNRCIQEIFPDAKPFEREQVLTGLCSDKCWNEYLGIKEGDDKEMKVKMKKLFNYGCMISGITISVTLLIAAPFLFHDFISALLGGIGGGIGGLGLFGLGVSNEFMNFGE